MTPDESLRAHAGRRLGRRQGAFLRAVVEGVSTAAAVPRYLGTRAHLGHKMTAVNGSNGGAHFKARRGPLLLFEDALLRHRGDATSLSDLALK